MDGNPNFAAPFLVKTYEMVDDPSTDSVVSWTVSGLSFVVWNLTEFSTELLPKYFKHNNFSSFNRQLNTYGFRKSDPERWEFANVEFVRGKRDLLKNIQRRKAMRSHSTRPLTDSERDEYLKTIEILKQEKHSFQSELDKHKHREWEYENQLRSLGPRIQNIDQRQKQLLITLFELLQKPTGHALTSQLTGLTSQHKKRRLIALHYLNHEEETSLDGHSSVTSNLIPSSVNMDLVEKLDSSLTFWDQFIDQTPSDDHRHYVNACPNDDDYRRSRDQVGSPDSPPGEFDVNAETMDGGAVSYMSPEAGANDVFWQQFLTTKDLDGDTTKKKEEDDGGVTSYPKNMPWWNNVDHNVIHNMQS